jgi:acetyltransferase-like isoleucine patch superfamily enzyme
MRSVLVLVVGLLPPGSWKNRLLNLLGHDIDPTATIAPVLIIGRTRLSVGPRVIIGPLNAFRDVSFVRIGAACQIGQLNWFTAAPLLVDGSPNPDAAVLEMGEAAQLTNRHYFDAAGGVFLGAYSVVAGVRSTFMTHGIDVVDNSMSTKPIRIGERSMVGSNCQLLPGALVPDRSVVAMGSTVVTALQGEEQLFAGAPAKAKKNLPASRFWTRTSGPVLPFWH